MTAIQKCGICRGDAHRHACDNCVNDIRRRLREIELYAAWLTTPGMLTPTRGPGGRGAPGYGSRPPIRLTALVMTDARSRTEPPAVDVARGIGVDEDTGVWPILGTLNVIANHIRTVQGHPAPVRPSITTEIGYMITQIDWAASQPAVAELAAQVRQLHVQARTVAHDTPPQPLGACLSVGCDGQVFPPPPHSGTTHCTACGRPYTGLGLVKLRLAQEAAG
jgi:hypothetical protein